jgi:putative ABC transport system substrate-binding protein
MPRPGRWCRPCPHLRKQTALSALLHLPTLGFTEGDLALGLTFVVGADRALLWRSAAGMVDRLLRGARVADLPFVRPTKVFTGVNQGVARRLGVEVPLAILARADEVIE